MVPESDDKLGFFVHQKVQSEHLIFLFVVNFSPMLFSCGSINIISR